MSATDELCKLLDERGVEYEVDERNAITKWSTHYGAFVYFARQREGKLLVETTVATEHSVILTPEQAIAATLGTEINGETSDGYHTFNELYHHRAVLFSVVVANHRGMAWKARKHHDGTMYDGMFIVGVETPWGQASYHYDLDPYWGMFDCDERETAPEWDGHTPDDAIERIGKLAMLGGGECEMKPIPFMGWKCSKCGKVSMVFGDVGKGRQMPNFCPNCGKRIRKAVER